MNHGRERFLWERRCAHFPPSITSGANFLVSQTENTVSPRAQSRPSAVILGAQWGDEGKGKIVDVLSEKFDIIARYAGGHNAGHTVIIGGQKFVLQLIPCGVLRPGRKGVIGNGVVLDPAAFLNEVKKLKDAVTINIPKLNEMAYEQVELASVPFLTFVANKNPKGDTANYSFVLRGYVRHWLGNVWGEYDRVKLLDLFDTSGSTVSATRAQGGNRS